MNPWRRKVFIPIEDRSAFGTIEHWKAKHRAEVPDVRLKPEDEHKKHVFDRILPRNQNLGCNAGGLVGCGRQRE